MKLENIFIGAVLFGLVFITGLQIYGEGLSRYDVEADTDSTFGKMSYNLKAIYDYQDDVKEKIQGGKVTDAQAVDEMVKGGYTGIRNNPFTAIEVATNATMTLAQETGYVSPELVGFFMTVFSLLVVFAIIQLIFRFRSN